MRLRQLAARPGQPRGVLFVDDVVLHAAPHLQDVSRHEQAVRRVRFELRRQAVRVRSTGVVPLQRKVVPGRHVDAEDGQHVLLPDVPLRFALQDRRPAASQERRFKRAGRRAVGTVVRRGRALLVGVLARPRRRAAAADERERRSRLPPLRERRLLRHHGRILGEPGRARAAVPRAARLRAGLFEEDADPPPLLALLATGRRGGGAQHEVAPEN
mmetsp:Transcript_23216/g.69623  ORF Transcript_23216/g.69623 Transcript_23216/m.69623 type:complete len:214 (-) Transcript_23216:841-1482(-)